MIKHFYSYHVEIESVIIEINSLDIEPHEKKHLIDLAESHVHNSILDTILSELAPVDKKDFLLHINKRDEEKIWKFLRSKIENAESKIISAANVIKKSLIEDIKSTKLQ